MRHESKIMGLVALAGLTILALSPIVQATTVTFETTNQSNIRWSVGWGAQSLVYGEWGVSVEKIDAVIKDGMTNNSCVIAFYEDYNGAGTFSGLIYSETFTITQNVWDTYTFATPVELQGEVDGKYYIHFSPAIGGVVHQFYWNLDDGSNPLRHGVGPAGGMAYFSNATGGVGNDVDLGYLRLYTDPLPEPHLTGVLGFLALTILRRRK